MDSELLKKIVFDLITSGNTADGSTKKFEDLKHNDDLLPMIQEKLELILDYFYKYREIVYDVQGIRDHGVDMVLKYTQDDEPRKIGFQIKSFDDIEAEGWQKTLKSQMYEAHTYHSNGMEDFYILFCTNIIKHKDKIRNATADIVANNQFITHSITPNKVLHFLNLHNAEIGAYIKRRLSLHDHVFAEAVDNLDQCTLLEGALIIDLLVEIYINRSDVLDENLLNSSVAIDVIDTYSIKDQLLENAALNVLNKGFFHQETYSGKLSIQSYNTQAIGALAYDAKVRYGYDDDEIKSYLFHSLMADQIKELLNENSIDEK